MLKSRNYPPSAALAPFIARHYIFDAELPADFELVDRLLSETAFIRILLKGDWAAEVAPGEWKGFGPMVFTGPNARPFKVRVRGPFRVAGIAFRPCGWRALFDEPASAFGDQVMAFGDVWGAESDALLEAVASAADDAAVVAACEAAVSARLDARGNGCADEAMRRFERIARNDSTMQVKEAAAQLGLTPRQFERRCHACFGHGPKTVLRRSRFLDMAAALRGFGNASDEELAALRYFDQSHRNREFRRFIGMTPGQFAATPTPLLTAGLELRELRKAEDSKG